jgi:alpha-2-macroglobulin-like protein
MRLSPLVICLAAACTLQHSPPSSDRVTAYDARTSEVPVLHLADFETSPEASETFDREWAKELDTRADAWFENHSTRRLYVQLDRPLYRPGETVWLKTWDIRTRGFGDDKAGPETTYEIINPRGQVIESKLVPQAGATATNDFVVPAEAPGGKWTLKVTSSTGETAERPFIVNNYEPPTIHKDLEFVREAYGPGDRVEALVELKHGTAGPLANHKVRALLQVDGETVLEEFLETDATGAVMVSGNLPADLASGDGLLTVLVESGGITESISRSIPIVLADLKLAFFPEGGDLVQDLPGRVYFEGQDRHGEPADIEGYIVDDRGEHVADFASLHDGMGRFSMTPQGGRSYTAHITAPEGVASTFEIPTARLDGCTLRSFDDVNTKATEIRAAVRCATQQEVAVTAVLQEAMIGHAVVKAGPNRDAIVHLTPEEATRQGAVRLTVFDKRANALAERLVYRNRGEDLRIEITPERQAYGPRDRVVVDVKTTGPDGKPVAAEIALSVVDAAVLNLADDEEGNMLTKLYLEPELHDSPEDPGWYFDPAEEDGARGLDLVMGTKGWRHFEWHRVWEPEGAKAAAIPTRTGRYRNEVVEIAHLEFEEDAAWGRNPMMVVPEMEAPPRPAPPAVLIAQPVPQENRRQADAQMPVMPEVVVDMPMKEPVMGLFAQDRHDMKKMHHGGRRKALEALGYAEMPIGGEWAGRDIDDSRVVYASVRTFPKPNYEAGFTGVRTDFRDTVVWEPKVQTDKWGNAEVSFYLSDAVTSFRVTAEGMGSGLVGHGEQTLTSVLPVSLQTKLPTAVSAGDRITLPLTVSNTRNTTLKVALNGSFDALLTPIESSEGTLTVDAGTSDTFWMPIEVGQGNSTAKIRLSANANGLSDTIERTIEVVPTGFPRTWNEAGELSRKSVHTFNIGEIVESSLEASVTWHPSPVANLIEGMEGLIQTPGGCFEQTSSTNWPNVAILNYLEAHDGDPRMRLKSAQALEVGYNKLSGYQVGAGGFETWGSGPGKETLSAFGLLQFVDMQKVNPNVSNAIIERDAKYLLKQRNGKGGYTNSGDSAHGFGSSPPAVNNGFITWSLVATGHADQLKTEISHQAQVAKTTNDPYVLALAARTLSKVSHQDSGTALKRLAGIQAADGSFPGAESSITRSYEANLVVETTSLAAMAFMDAGSHRTQSDKAATWLIENRQHGGTWGATQATALALAALTTHAQTASVPNSDGVLSVEVNGKRVGTLEYRADQTTALTIDGWEDALKEGQNQIILRHDGDTPLPFSVDVAWKAITPFSDPGAELTLQTRLDRTSMSMGETARLTATIDNRTDRIVPSPIARIGLPAGLEAQTWQLEEMQERGEIAFFELRPREVTIYWDGIHIDQSHDVDLDLVALVPGEFTGPASSAYPYYNDDEKAWDNGMQMVITRR